MIGQFWKQMSLMEVFLHIPPTYSIITNIDREHMDFYKSMDDLEKYFINLYEKVPSFGKSFICLDDPK